MTDRDKDLRVATLTRLLDDCRRLCAERNVLLHDFRNFVTALFLDMKTAGIAEATIAKYPELAKLINGALKTGTDR